MDIFYRVICVAIGYCFGLFQTAYIYGRFNGIDIRQFGSGNSGTTNAMRVLGKKAGLITYAGDMLKAVLSGFVIRIIFGLGMDMSSDIVFLFVIYGGLGVILGHNYPFYMGFKGGKGIAASTGVAMSIWDWKLVLIGAATFAGITYLTKYVSVGSICMMIGFAAEFILFSELGMLSPISGSEHRIEAYILVILFAGLAIFKHRANIKRLMSGTENKIGQKKTQTNEE